MDMSMQPKKTRNSIAKQAEARGPLPALPPGMIEQLIDGPISPTEFDDLVMAFSKALAERAMKGELNQNGAHQTRQDLHRNTKRQGWQF
jgi:putative transposase